MSNKLFNQKVDANHQLWKSKEQELLDKHAITAKFAELPAVMEAIQGGELLIDIKNQGATTLSVQVGNEATTVNFIISRNYLQSMHQVSEISYNPALLDFLVLWLLTGKASFTCNLVLLNYTPFKDEILHKLESLKNLTPNAIAQEYNKTLAKNNQISRSLSNFKMEGWLPYAIGGTPSEKMEGNANDDLVFVNYAKNILLKDKEGNDEEGIALMNTIYRQGTLIDVQEMLFSQEDVNALIYLGLTNPGQTLEAPEKYPILTPLEFWISNFAQKYNVPQCGIPQRFIKDPANWTKIEQSNFKNALLNTIMLLELPPYVQQDDPEADVFKVYEEYLEKNNLKDTFKAKDTFISETQMNLIKKQQAEVKEELDKTNQELEKPLDKKSEKK